MDIGTLFSGISKESPSRQDGRVAYADAASKAANTKVYQRAVDSALLDLQSVSYAGEARNNVLGAFGRPQLVVPSMSTANAKAGSTDKFTHLIASLIVLLGDVSVESLKSRIELLKSASQHAANASKEQSEKYLYAVSQFEALVNSAGVAQKNLDAASASLDSAKGSMTDAEAVLSATLEGTPEYSKALLDFEEAQLKVSNSRQQFTQFQAEFKEALDKSKQAGVSAEDLAKGIQDSVRLGQPILDGMKSQLNASATMILMMMRFAELMGESAESKIEMEQALFRSMQAARQEFLEKKSDEYLQQVAKSEAASKTMGCIGKIVGAVLMLAGLAGALFTGGASLVIAGLGLALTAADMLIKELTGFSVMDAIMKPLMDSVVAPMIQAISKAIAAVLEKMDIDEKSAQMAGMILGAIIGAVAMVAVVAVVGMVGKAAAGRLASSLGNKLGNMASKMVPDVLKQFAKGASKSFTNVMTRARSAIGLRSDPNSLAMYSSRIGAGVAITEAGSVSAQSALQIKSGVHQRNAAQHMAEANFAMVISEQLKNYLNDMIQVFDESMKAKDAAVKKALDLQDSMYFTGLSVARNI